MSVRVLIIDGNARFRELVGHHITAEWMDAVITEHDPCDGARLPQSFSAADCDVVLLDHTPGEESGLEWLREFKRRPGFPPVIFFTAPGDEGQAVRAIKAGAEEYIVKEELDHEFLVNAIRDSVRQRKRTTALFEALTDSDNDIAGPGPLRIKGYRFVRQLAGGNNSSVYLAESGQAGRQVVLKVLRQVPDLADGKSTLERFLQEYEVIAKISHPNVVKIYGLGIADDHAYISMEYFPAGDLKMHLDGGAPPDLALDYLTQMASALNAIHAVGVLHRDLKPGNVMLREEDSIALIDFGLAKQMKLEAELTDSGAIFGTPYYMSPEQGHGDHVDERSDIYSLGVIFYEMLTGKKPYVASSPMAVIYKHSHAEIPRLPVGLSGFQPLVDRLMAKSPQDRFQSAEQLVHVLLNFQRRRSGHAEAIAHGGG